MFAWQFSKMPVTRRAARWTKFGPAEHYNLLYARGREMLPLCADRRGVLPWSRSPGAASPGTGAPHERSSTDNSEPPLPGGDRSIVEAVTRIAGDRGVPRAQVGLAWLLHPGTVAHRSRPASRSTSRTRGGRTGLSGKEIEERNSLRSACDQRPLLTHRQCGRAANSVPARARSRALRRVPIALMESVR